MILRSIRERKVIREQLRIAEAELVRLRAVVEQQSKLLDDFSANSKKLIDATAPSVFELVAEVETLKNESEGLSLEIQKLEKQNKKLASENKKLKDKLEGGTKKSKKTK